MEPLLLLAPGAGAHSASPWMEGWARRLGALGRVARFDYPYMAAGRPYPDPLPRLIEAHAAALSAARRGREPAVLVGKSMGSRVGCHLSISRPVEALVCLGYPLRGQRGQLRDEVLRALRVPVLFVQGTRDKLCPLEELKRVRGTMAVPTRLHVVEGGDHSLELGARALKAAGRTQEQVDGEALAAVTAFLAEVLPPQA